MATDAQRASLRIYFNDSAGDIWTDSEIDSILAMAATFYDDETMILLKARLVALDQLLLDAAKRTSYRQNASSESQSDIFKALKTMREIWLGELVAQEPVALGSAFIRGIRKHPKRTVARPD